MLFLSKTQNFSHHTLVISLPYEVNRERAKFLLCGGITGFHCIIQCSAKSNDIIRGLSYMSIECLHILGYQMTAFCSNIEKEEGVCQSEIDHFVNPRDLEGI
jgi:D-arabinose 1-dehydrogenase-like Zn-dependent alcohol dehydrogenase